MVVKPKMPQFLIIGAQKSGTTWLVDMLRDHEGVFIPRDEIHFFNTHYQKGILWYENHFTQATNTQLIGEKTPDYLGGEIAADQAPFIAERIKEQLPNAKLIAVLRNPVDRAISAFNHYVRTQKLSPLLNPNTYFLERQFQKDRLGIMHYGSYEQHLEAYDQLFDAESLLVLYYEDMMRDKQKTMNKVCEFLDLPKQEFPNLERRSNAFKKSKLGLIITYYVPFLKRLGWQFDKILPTNKQEVNRPTRAFLETYYKTTVAALRNRMGYVPAKWEANET